MLLKRETLFIISLRRDCSQEVHHRVEERFTRKANSMQYRRHWSLLVFALLSKHRSGRFGQAGEIVGEVDAADQQISHWSADIADTFDRSISARRHVAETDFIAASIIREYQAPAHVHENRPRNAIGLAELCYAGKSLRRKLYGCLIIIMRTELCRGGKYRQSRDLRTFQK